MKAPIRICIYAKDIQTITGQSQRQARRILNDIRKQLGKQENQYITVEEFCKYKGLPVKEVLQLLNG